MTGTGRDYGLNAMPLRYPDPDVVVLDKRFAALQQGNTPIQRLWTGSLWAEGPAWSANGRYLVWSDIPNNRQLRWLDEDGHVSVFRSPSGNSNGNTFDAQGRQISCEHLNRRVVRYELDGSQTVLADAYEGKPLNSPNDVAVHADGSVWFTDPPYGTIAVGGYEGTPGGKVYHDCFVYRVDATSGAVTRVLPVSEMDRPNGLCFSPDFSRLYVVDTGEPKDIRVYDVVDGTKLANGRQFTDLSITVDGEKKNAMSDGIRVDIHGNVWSAAAGGPGIDGVQVFTPEGERIGQILLPERCANLCFGGAKRNRLFMAASQSIYSLYVNTRGAHWS
ncbi:MAG: SMP-30/gluconolactonase/LRE family protein [Chloroflexi bacterium]|nr:SMP-30/gluconolactonase/LRE family protein [Chloroflexota bacterium]